MTKHPKISVVMPVYNARAFVAEAIESILAQSFTDFEFLMIDDGSTDESLRILRRYESQDARIKVLARQNKGAAASANELLAWATGDYIARMDADDVSLPHRFRLQIEALDADPELVCVGGSFELIDEKGRLLTCLAVPTQDSEIQRQALAGHGSICHPAAMIRRTAIERIGGYSEDIRHAEDLDLWLRLGEVGKLGNLPISILRYRLHNQSVSERAGLEQREYARTACERAWRRRGIAGTFEAGEAWRPGKDRRSRAKFSTRSGWWAFNSGERSTALVYGTRAVQAAPLNRQAWKLVLCAALKPAQRQRSSASIGRGAANA